MVVVTMGVAGAGKTTVGRLLARELGWTYHDADDFHPPANVEKMRRGEPLTDADRDAWLAALAGVIARHVRDGVPAVVGASALRQRHRERLRAAAPEVRFAYLKADPSVLRGRLAGRRGHFFPPSLLDSQLATLEEPAEALVVDAARPVPEVVAAIRSGLGI
jgi:gluconokinase